MNPYTDNNNDRTPYKTGTGTNYGAWKPGAGLAPAQPQGPGPTRGFTQNVPTYDSAGKQNMFNDINAKQYLQPGKFGPAPSSRAQSAGFGLATGTQPGQANSQVLGQTSQEARQQNQVAQQPGPDYSLQGQLAMFQKMRQADHPAAPAAAQQNPAAAQQQQQQTNQPLPPQNQMNAMWDNLRKMQQNQMLMMKMGLGGNRSRFNSPWARNPFFQKDYEDMNGNNGVNM